MVYIVGIFVILGTCAAFLAKRPKVNQISSEDGGAGRKMKGPRIFASVMFCFMTFCSIQSINWHPRIHGWHPAWWQSGLLAFIGDFYTMLATIPVFFLSETRISTPDWVAYASIYTALALELLATWWVFYRIGICCVNCVRSFKKGRTG